MNFLANPMYSLPPFHFDVFYFRKFKRGLPSYYRVPAHATMQFPLLLTSYSWGTFVTTKGATPAHC